jgi:hypothetical protein
MKILIIAALVTSTAFAREVVDINRAMQETVLKESNDVNMDQFKKRPEMGRTPASSDWEQDTTEKVDKSVRQTGHKAW